MIASTYYLFVLRFGVQCNVATFNLTSRGDQFVRLKVVIPGPSQLTPRQKQLLEEFDAKDPPVPKPNPSAASAAKDDKDKDNADRSDPPSEPQKDSKEASSSNSVGMIGKAWKKLGELFSFSDAADRQRMPIQTI